jgi:lipoate-protein ligase A
MTTEEDPILDVAESLRRDEAALVRGAYYTSAAIVRDLALTLGVSQSDRTASAERARALGIPVLRRSTGGSGLLHEPGDLLWSVVLPRSDPRVGRDFARAYPRLGSGPARFLKGQGLADARWEPAPGLSSDLCLFGSRGQVLVAKSRIVGGASQHLTSRALLHHGALSGHVDRGRLARIFDAAPADLERRLASLDELLGDVASATLLGRLRENLGRALDERLANPTRSS